MQNRLFVLVFLSFISIQAISQSPDVIRTYIDTYKDVAIREMQRTGVPAAVKLAQGIHETSAGTSDLVLSSNNHFGIKCKSDWKGESVRHDDDLRQECFRKYPSAEDSYRDHSNFLKGSPRYSFLFNLEPTDYKGWANGLKRAGYATNPKYPQIIIKLIEDYNLEDYTLIAMGKGNEILPRTVISSEPIPTNIQQPVEEPVRQDPTAQPVKKPAPSIITKDSKVTEQPGMKNNDQQHVRDDEQKAPVMIQPITMPAPAYPGGVFRINETPVVYVSKGTSYLSIATQNNLPLARVFEFNDLSESEFVDKDRLVYLQRKRKTGDHEFHKVEAGESLHDIAQKEALRLESLLEYNLISADQKPAVGEMLNLRAKTDHAPVLMLKENYAWNTSKPVNSTASPIVYTVLPKETIYAIAKRFQVQIADIVKWNNLSGYDLKSGQQLKIYK